MVKRGKVKKKTKSARRRGSGVKARFAEIKTQEAKILAQERQIAGRARQIAKQEKRISREVVLIRSAEKEILEEEKRIEKYLRPKILKKLTGHDVGQAIVGAFFGLVAHFGFIKGLEIVENIDVFRAIGVLILAYLIAIVFLYYAGFRKIKKSTYLGFIPRRATLIYFIALFIVIVVLFLFNIISVGEILSVTTFKQIAVTQLLAVIGAVTADLIGGQG